LNAIGKNSWKGLKNLDLVQAGLSGALLSCGVLNKKNQNNIG
jgi:hypothetical protein